MKLGGDHFDYNSGFGTLKTTRGREDGVSLYEWAPVPPCTDKQCPLDVRCPFTFREGKCKVIAGIIRSAISNILNNYGPKLNNSQKNRIGQHLMPLYMSLARMFVVETALDSPQFTDKYGFPKMHPVYKEIRETVRGIEVLWKQIGLVDMPIGKVEFGTYYDRMEKELQDEREREQNKPKLKKRKKNEKDSIPDIVA